MNAEKLLELATILDKADALHREHEEPAYSQRIYYHRCGTPACALGHWAAAHPDTWVTWHEDPLSGYPTMRFNNQSSCSRRVMLEFDLEEDESDELFNSDGCGNAKTAADAAAYIRAFVARKLAKRDVDTGAET